LATTPGTDRRPPRWRLIPELLSLLSIPLRSAITRWPRGERSGPKVIVIPGFLANDESTAVLRKHLARAGYRVSGWGLGLNRGVRKDSLERILGLIDRVAGDETVVLIGWSLGGLYAREAAKQRPERVAKVITLGSPFSGDPRCNNVWRLYEWIAGHPVDSPPVKADLREKPPVPTIALWSAKDGIVAPSCSRGGPGEADRTVEVPCTHMGFVAAPVALAAIMEAVASR
jgi:alpha-beta hydrolase superfamily lysophospholipase